MLEEEIKFILELDKMKSVYRRTYITSGDRRENDAEHSFHIALMAHLLKDYTDKPIDVDRVCKMLLAHDLVEIDAGDTFAYDAKGYEDKNERELRAANRLYGLLKEDQGKEFFDLWLEFEEMKTNDSLYANAMDRLQPIMMNYYGKVATWALYPISREMVYKRLEPIREISNQLWTYACNIVDDYFDKHKGL